MSIKQASQTNLWTSGAAYEAYVGRWSRRVAKEFMRWLDISPGSRWLDAGCGTGALCQTILEQMAPAWVSGIDRSDRFAAMAKDNMDDPRAAIAVGDIQALPVKGETFDAAVSGLVLNFAAKPQSAIDELARAVRTGGVAAVYVWDYAENMQFMRHFWDAAAALDPKMVELDEGRRFSVCNPPGLTALFENAHLDNIQVRPIDVNTHFKDFDDYWSPFLGGTGPAPSYLKSLPEAQRTALREHIRAGLPFAPDGSIPLVARAWAIRGQR
jgi:SAM-dependent methyltransferase